MDRTCPFLCLRFINNSRDFPGDKSTVIQRPAQPRENNVTLVQMSFLNSVFELNDYWINAVKELQNVGVGRRVVYRL